MEQALFDDLVQSLKEPRRYMTREQTVCMSAILV